MNTSSPNLLEEALTGGDIVSGPKRRGRVVVIEDCVETSGGFLLHHFIKRALSSHSSDVVVFLAFAQPFSHYDRILRKMGCNLAVHRDNQRFLFLDMLMMEFPDGGETIENGLLALYGKLQKTVEVSFASEGLRNITVMIDDVSQIEVAANGSSSHVLDFLHYCYTLTTEFGCSLVTLNHEDIYLSMDKPGMILQMEYLADVVIKTEPLSTGLATDVHGQLTVINRGVGYGSGSSGTKARNFHYQIKESNVEYFYPGSRN
ncbi:elongator complex protein 6 [Ipomoea triloba]|uniref:elongator complex protein 6 n=1 Tax=Ipomoea triloba TaxID=35885 RepID=UPI00125DDA10|nr:elongator complex protein 6 [Ipomoea triloba]